MSTPKWVQSDVHRELRRAVKFARGKEKSIAKKIERQGFQMEVSPEDVSLVLDNVTDDELRDLAGELAEEFHKQDEGPKASDTVGSGQRVMADGGGGFFEGRSGRVFFVTLSMINTGMATTYLQSESPSRALFPIAVLVLCLGMYLLNEYAVELDVQ